MTLRSLRRWTIITWACAAAAPAHAQVTEAIRVESGLLTGTAGADPSVTVYRGVPYAAPPVGALRCPPIRGPTSAPPTLSPTGASKRSRARARRGPKSSCTRAR